MLLRRVSNELAVLAAVAAAVALGSLIGFAASGTDGTGLALGGGLGAVFWTGAGWVLLRRAGPRALDGAPALPPGATPAPGAPQALVAGLVYAVVVGVSEAAAIARDDHTPTLAGIAVGVAVLLSLQRRALRAIEQREGVEVWRAGRQLYVRPTRG